jgi:hypothetical protein
MKALIIAIMLIGMAGAVGGPAGVVLNTEKMPVPTIDLSGVNAEVFNATEFDNGDIGTGHYFSELVTLKQATGPTDLELQNWSEEWIELPSSFVRN